jgi:hypothetical protein
MEKSANLIRRFCFKNDKRKSALMLVGILDGITADSIVNDAESLFLELIIEKFEECFSDGDEFLMLEKFRSGKTSIGELGTFFNRKFFSGEEADVLMSSLELFQA